MTSLLRNGQRLSQAFFCTIILGSTSANALSLSQAVGLALEYSPALKAAEQAQAATTYERPIADSQFNILGNATLQASVQQVEDFDATTPASASLNLSQNLYDVASALAQDRADRVIAQGEVNLSQQQQQVILQTAQAYLATLRSQDQVRLAQAELEAIEKQLEIAQGRFDNGIGAIIDVTDTTARRDQAFAQLVNAQNSTQNTMAALSSALGQRIDNIEPLSANTITAPEPNDLNAWIVRAKSEHPSLRNSALELELSQLNVDVADKATSPTVSWQAQLTHSRPDDVEDPNTSASVSMSLNWPLFTGGRASALLDQAYNQLDATRLQQTATELGIIDNVRAAFLTASGDVSRVDALRQSLKSNNISLETVQLSYDNGLRTAADVITALRGVYAAENALSSAIYDAIYNRLNLEFAAGSLDIQDLAAY